MSDHFENMYVVLSGEKTFTLLPPTDVAFLPSKSYPTLRHTVSETAAASPSHRLKISDLDHSSAGCPSEDLAWIGVDVDALGAEKEHAELFARVRPIRCTVKAGETLYIPSMWYHQVSQTQLTISINYWYEQRFDFR
jgi:jumonji domain-containing protein 7